LLVIIVFGVAEPIPMGRQFMAAKQAEEDDEEDDEDDEWEEEVLGRGAKA
jgi:hypothetical protein